MQSLLRSARARIIAAAGVIALIALNALPASSGPVAPAADSAVADYVAAQIADAGYPGASIAIVRDGRLSLVRGVGAADGSGRPMTPDIPFVIGSLSKSLTALAVLRLADAGAVELDAPVARYLPGFRTASADPTPITVRDALTQTSGLPGSAIDLSSPVSTITDQIVTLATVEPVSAPGARYAYSNANYVVLGAVIEAVTGQDYPTAMQTLVFDPLGMKHTTADPDAARGLGLGDAHRLWFGLAIPRTPLFRSDLAPAGFIASTASDMARPIEMLLAGGTFGAERILSPAGVAALTTGAVSTGFGDARYAMGWIDSTHEGLRTIAHDGSTTDMAAVQVIAPASRDAVVVLANAQSIPYEVLGKIDMIGQGTLAQMLGRQADGTLERFYPIVDAVLLVILILMVRGHVRLARRVRDRERSAALGRIRRVGAMAFHGYLDLVVPLLLLVRVPTFLAAPWPVVIRTDIGLVVAILIVVRLSGGGLRLAGWWRTRGLPYPVGASAVSSALIAG